MTDPCVAFEPAAFRFNPFKPKAPRLYEANCPAEFKPLTAPFAEPAAPTPARLVASTAPPALFPTLPAVLVTPPTAPPAVFATPPTTPRPLALAPPYPP